MATSVRLGLTHAAVRSAIAADLKERGLDEQAEAIADAVADAIDANNAEILRQLRDAFGLLQGAPPPNFVFPEAEE
jgi:hypothetical protein